ncbi:hypothetical protein AJ79_00241 [Helicocarpus griseus UAMH5409]|uniref:Uncharacterized protein n=1 Tax=Helicocarpus griseus UAMH5409 TaxID=1447875 RepID=A0A2B7YD45_9EURO|nr:hypothetical protein AJ79_00241 [Helicocarpus griseus UAMH5409]
MAPVLNSTSLLTIFTLVLSATAFEKRADYQRCGGFVVNPKPCPADHVCIDDPRRPGCGMACDIPGICVKKEFCGGIAGIPCPSGKECFDDPTDNCDPKKGGADCAGICI